MILHSPMAVSTTAAFTYRVTGSLLPGKSKVGQILENVTFASD